MLPERERATNEVVGERIESFAAARDERGETTLKIANLGFFLVVGV